MDIIKLDNRHLMKRAGYNYAAKLPYTETIIIGNRLIDVLNRIHDTHAVFYRFHKVPWNRYYGPQWGFYQTKKRALWIAVVNEADLTAALLCNNH